MPYPAITSRRIPYDIDGTVVGYNSDSNNPLADGILVWADSTLKTNLNNMNANIIVRPQSSYTGTYIWIFLPEKVEIEAAIILVQTAGSFGTLEGSNDSSNGIDGTWETAVLPNGNPLSYITDSNFPWRNNIKAISFSEAKKVLRCRIDKIAPSTGYIKGFHFFGRKASGETPDDILFCDINGNELTALMDWGDRPEGTTQIKSFKLKNASATKIANNVNLQLNHADFLMSLDQVNWVATIGISSIPANSLSAEIFIKNALNPPPLTLGPKAARIIATVGSFT